jgi:hypothetical protein
LIWDHLPTFVHQYSTQFLTFQHVMLPFHSSVRGSNVGHIPYIPRFTSQWYTIKNTICVFYKLLVVLICRGRDATPNSRYYHSVRRRARLVYCVVLAKPKPSWMYWNTDKMYCSLPSQQCTVH